METKNIQHNNFFEEQLTKLYIDFNKNNYFYNKMSLKGKMLGELEHQWKQPFNYIATNLFHLEVNAELNKLDLDTVYKFNENVNQAIQDISNNLSNFNELFKDSNSPCDFFFSTIIEKYMNIIIHKLRNNDINLKYKNLIENDKKIFNYENETGLIFVILLDVFSDFLIKRDAKNISINLNFIETTNCSLECHINYNFDIDELFENYSLELYMIKLLEEKTNIKLSMHNNQEKTLFVLSRLC